MALDASETFDTGQSGRGHPRAPSFLACRNKRRSDLRVPLTRSILGVTEGGLVPHRQWNF